MPVNKRGRKSRPGSAADTPMHQDPREGEPLASFKTSGITNLYSVAKPFKNAEYKSGRRWKNLKQVVAQEQADSDWPVDFPAYWAIDAPPSLAPQKKYCDITGLPAKYTDPKTNVRYHSAEVYQIVRTLPPGAEQQYLALRNASVTLK
ncbi:Co-chaperone [Coemansia sp. RSA 2706]|nr:Co-chaperone [Coemansia sp. RSA 2711]KAJ1839861.1 Co-chaperone [Coemansia sp. RSA 2708]KAJ2295584.1 Co-chaperone [Coemansia sp. RSA 2706]KAJ2304305.1 Co-chaperone [Coemansia sp. RSA 2705]KAJ2309408.1 Co-chaperone [Coemansia sp. RSA 2704]KAJ2319735.1 Co-chaperone [Coemansia sp. RSA 2702]KAJ2369597.1 Co-chaperone [Coemansia sp. RSA 2610]KAJ2392098.1 Co-chaperone [Coemansia sp. RSA 2611]KAJ2715435.1 Co-chaperone [Coemansia sp. Cherry 401B]